MKITEVKNPFGSGLKPVSDDMVVGIEVGGMDKPSDDYLRELEKQDIIKEDEEKQKRLDEINKIEEEKTMTDGQKVANRMGDKVMSDISAVGRFLTPARKTIKNIWTPIEAGIVGGERQEDRKEQKARIEDYDRNIGIRQIANNELSEVRELEQSLLNMEGRGLTENDMEYVKVKKYLTDKKKSYQSKIALIGGVKNDYLAIDTTSAFIKFDEDILSNYIVNQENSKKFYEATIGRYQPKGVQPTTQEDLDSEMRNYYGQMITARTANSLMSSFSSDVKEMVKYGTVTDYDQEFTKKEFVDTVNGMSDILLDEVMNNKEQYIKSDGSLDHEKVNEFYFKSEKAKEYVDYIENYKKSAEDSGQIQELMRPGTRVAKEYSNLVVGKKMLLDRLSENASGGVEDIKQAASGEDSNVDRTYFGSADQKRIIWDIAGDPSYIKRLALYADPVNIAVLAGEIALAVSSAGTSTVVSAGNLISKIGKVTRVIPMFDKAYDSSKIFKFGSDFLSFAVRKAPMVMKEIAIGTPLDTTIDALTDGYDEAGINIFLGGLPGLFANVGKASASKLVDEVVSMNDPLKARKIFIERRGLIPPESMDFSDAKAVKSMVTAHTAALDTVEGQNKILANLRLFDKLAEDKNIYDINFYNRLYLTPEKLGDFGKEIIQANPTLWTAAQKILGNEAISEAKKVEQVTSLTADFFRGYGAGDVTNAFTRKIKSVKQGAVVDTLARVIREKTGRSEGESLSIAFAAIYNNPKDIGSLNIALQSIGSAPIEGGDDLLAKIGEASEIYKDIQKSPNPISDVVRSFADESIEETATKPGGIQSVTDEDYSAVKGMNYSSKTNAFVTRGLDSFKELTAGYISDDFVQAFKKLYVNFTPKTSVTKFKSLFGNIHNGITQSLIKKSSFTDIKKSERIIEKNVNSFAKEIGRSLDKKLVESISKNLIGFNAQTLNVLMDDDYKYLLDKGSYTSIYKSYVDSTVKKYMLSPQKYKEEMFMKLDLLNDTERESFMKIVNQTNDILEASSRMFSDILYKSFSTNADKFKNFDTFVQHHEFMRSRSIVNNLSTVARQDYIETKFINGELTQYQQALRDGVSVKGMHNYIPNVETVVSSMVDSLKTGKEYHIPAAYLNKDGSQLLGWYFDGVKGFESILKNSFEFAVKKEKSYAGLLASSFFTDDGLQVFSKIDGKEFNIFDILDNLDPRLTEGIGVESSRGGVILSPALTMTKYLQQTSDTFLEKYSSVLNSYFDNKAATNVTMKGLQDSFMKRLGYVDMEYGEAYMKFYNEVFADIANNVGALGVTKGNIIDILHPLIYAPDDYIFGVGRSMFDVDVIKSTSANLLNKYNVQDTLGTELFNKVTNVYTLEMGAGIRAYTRGQAIRNVNANLLESYIRKYVLENETVLDISREDFSDFLYKQVGSLVFADTPGYSTNVLDLLGGSVTRMASDFTDNADVISKMRNDISKLIYTSTQGIDQKLVSSIKETIGSMKDGSQFVLEKFEVFLNHLGSTDSSAVRHALVDDLVSYFMKSSDVYKQGGGVDDIIESVRITEEVQKEMTKLVGGQQQELGKKMLGDILDMQAGLIDPKTKKPMYTNVRDIADTFGLPQEDVISIFMGGGLSEESAKKLYTAAKLDTNGFFDLIVGGIQKGDINMHMLIKNKTVRTVLQDFIKPISEVKQDTMYYDLSKDGFVVRKNTVGMGSKTQQFLNKLTSLNIKSISDVEVRDIITRMRKQATEGRIFEPKLKIPELKGVSAHNGFYTSFVKRTLDGWDKKRSMPKASMDEVVNNVFKNISIKESSYSTNSNMVELHNFLSNYRDDMIKYRGEELYEVGNIKKAENLSELGRMLGGSWVNYTNADMSRLKRKVGVETDWIIRGDWERQMFYGGLQKKSFVGKATDLINKAAAVRAFNWITNPQKATEQALDNYVGAQSILHSYASYDPEILDGLKKLISDDTNFSLYGGIVEYFGRTGDGIIGKSVDLVTQALNGMYISDAVAKPTVIRSALAQSLYDFYEVKGVDGIREFFTNTEVMKDFMVRMDLQSFNTFTSETAVRKKILQISKTPDEDLLLYRSLRSFYKEAYQPTIEKTHGLIGLSYATDNIPELARIPLIDGNPFIFTLKRWAFSKVMEYGTRIGEDIKTIGLDGFVGKLMNDEYKSLNMIGYNLAKYIRLNNDAAQVSGDDNISWQELLFMKATPLVALNMTIFSGLQPGIEKFNQEVNAGSSYAEAALWAATQAFTSTFSTIGMYHSWVINDFNTAYKTGNSFEGDIETKLGKMITTRIKASLIETAQNGLVSRYKGKPMITDLDGTDSQDILAKAFNYRWGTKLQHQKDINELYSYLSKDVGPLGKTVSILGTIPLYRSVRNIFLDDSESLGIMRGGPRAEAMKKYYEEKKLGIVYNKFAKNSEVDNYLSLFESSLLKSEIAKIPGSKISDAIINGGDITEDELYDEAMETGEGDGSSKVLSAVISALGYKSGIAKDIADTTYSVVSTEEYSRIYNEAKKLIDEANKKDKKLDMAKVGDSIVLLRSQLGSNIPLSGLLSAMRSAIKAESAKEVWGSDKEKMNKDLQFENGIPSKLMGATVTEEQKLYMQKVGSREKDLVKYFWPVIAENAIVGNALNKKFIESAQDLPVKGLNYDDIGFIQNDELRSVFEKNGLITDKAFNQFTEVLADVTNSVLKMSPDKQKKAMANVLNKATSVLSKGDNVSKAFTAYQIAPFVDKISGLAPEEFKKFIGGIGSGVITLVNTMTASTPTSLAAAIEVATGLAINSAEGGGRKGVGMQQPRTAKTKAERLLGAINGIEDLGAKIKLLNAPGGSRIRKIEYSVIKTPLGNKISMKPIEIDVPEIPIPKTGPVLGDAQKTKTITETSRSYTGYVGSKKSSTSKKIGRPSFYRRTI